MPPPRKPAKLPAGYCYRLRKRSKADGTEAVTRSPVIYKREFSGKTCRYINTGCTSLDAPAGWMANEVRARELGAVGLSDPRKAAKARPVLEHLDDYLAEVRESSRYAGYPKEIERELARLFAACAVQALRDLDPAKVGQYLASRTCTAGTKNKCRSYLFSFCKWLVQNDRLDANPVDRIKPAKVKLGDAAGKRKRRAYTIAELKKLVTAATTYPLDAALRPKGGRPRRDGAAVRYKTGANSLDPATVEALRLEGLGRQLVYRTLVTTGLRRGELSRVTVAMFDARRKTISR